MALQDTNLVVQMGKLRTTFAGTPQELADEMIRRMKIVSPSGINFIFVGDTEPTSNVGPWLKDGTKWYVFDDTINRYVPLDISDSETIWFQTGATTPSTSTPPVWLRTDKDPTEADPSVGNPLSWHVFNGTNWISFVGLVLSGPTTSRPTNPVDYQQFYDTTISTLIWFERSQWRTVTGVPGDCKFVAFQTLTEALQFNPGWQVFGSSNQTLRGRVPMMATKDFGATPETVLTTNPDIPERAAFDTFGETAFAAIDNTPPNHQLPPRVALWFLFKE